MPIRRRIMRRSSRVACRHIQPVPDDAARGWFDQPVDAAQQGGFARTAQADHGDELTLGHIKTHIRECLDAAFVHFGEMLDLKHGYIIVKIIKKPDRISCPVQVY